MIFHEEFLMRPNKNVLVTTFKALSNLVVPIERYFDTVVINFACKYLKYNLQVIQNN